MASLEKNFYGKVLDGTLIFKPEGGILFSPTDTRDHFVTPFFEPIRQKSGFPYTIRITLYYPRDQVPGTNCVIHLQDPQFNQISTDMDFSTPSQGKNRIDRVIQNVHLGQKPQRFRLIIGTTDGRPTFIPVTVRIEQSIGIADWVHHKLTGSRKLVTSMLKYGGEPQARVIFHRAGSDLYRILETSVYGDQSKKILLLKDEGILLEPTSGKDHAATPFIELGRTHPNSIAEARVEFTFPLHQTPGKNCVVYFQDDHFDVLSTLDFSFIPADYQDKGLIYHDFAIKPELKRMRVSFTSRDGKPTYIPASVEIAVREI